LDGKSDTLRTGLRIVVKGQKIRVVEDGGSLLIVDGDPIANINLIEDPARNLKIIIKDGRIYNNTL
jgi:imidazolonepropionase-like amidohydrolase